MKVQHYLVTKFNVGLYSDASSWELADKAGRRIAQEPDAWMEHRLELFETYCIPSVLNQSDQDFTWLLFLDSRTPATYRDRVRKLVSSCHASMLYPEPSRLNRSSTCQSLQLHVQRHLLKDTKYVITSLLDSDDAVHEHYIRRVRQALPHEAIRFRHMFDKDTTFASAAARIAVNFSWGYLFDGESTQLFMNACNPFVSMIEDVELLDRPVTALSEFHNDLCKIAAVIEFITEPMWVHTIHEWNLKNDFVGEHGDFVYQPRPVQIMYDTALVRGFLENAEAGSAKWSKFGLAAPPDISRTGTYRDLGRETRQRG